MITLLCTRLPDQYDPAMLAKSLKEKLDTTSLGAANALFFDAVTSGESKIGTAESLCGYLLLARLTRQRKLQGDSLSLSRNNNGKPLFMNDKFQFNISHSLGHVVSVLSDEGAVGVDIEAKQLPPKKSVKLAQRYFSPYEAAAVASNPNLFSALWCAKEAEVKFFGFSLADFFKSNKTNPEMPLFKPTHESLCLHSLNFENIPIFLCTKVSSHTISFSFLPFDSLF